MYMHFKLKQNLAIIAVSSDKQSADLSREGTSLEVFENVHSLKVLKFSRKTKL